MSGLGKGYAKAHPELIGAFMQASTADLAPQLLPGRCWVFRRRRWARGGGPRANAGAPDTNDDSGGEGACAMTRAAGAAPALMNRS